jgi:hypothetical protein
MKTFTLCDLLAIVFVIACALYLSRPLLVSAPPSRTPRPKHANPP